MRDWSYKRDATGRPRRFLNYREVAWWVLTRVGAVFIMFAGYTGATTLYRYLFDNASSLEITSALAVLLAAFVLWLGAFVIIYLYIVLSGGVVSREERSRSGRRDS